MFRRILLLPSSGRNNKPYRSFALSTHISLLLRWKNLVDQNTDGMLYLCLLYCTELNWFWRIFRIGWRSWFADTEDRSRSGGNYPIGVWNQQACNAFGWSSQLLVEEGRDPFDCTLRFIKQLRKITENLNQRIRLMCCELIFVLSCPNFRCRNWLPCWIRSFLGARTYFTSNSFWYLPSFRNNGFPASGDWLKNLCSWFDVAEK